MKNAPVQTANESALAWTADANDTVLQSPSLTFYLTSNPRELRVLNGLLVRSRTREHIDEIAGASNGPDLIHQLRKRGLDIPCAKIPVFDRDGVETKRGVYRLTESDRRKIRRAIRQRETRRGA
jgi:hypothetical protein